MFSEGDTPGLKEDDLKASIATLQSIADTLDYEMSELRQREVQDGFIVEYLLRKRVDHTDFMEVR